MVIVQRQDTAIVGLEDTVTTPAIVTGTIDTTHMCGFLCGLELWGGATGVEVGASYNLTIYEDYAMSKILVQFLAITDFTQNTLIKDASGDDINYDALSIMKAYRTYDVNGNIITKLYYKMQCTTGAGTITTPLTFNLVTKTLGQE